MGKRILLSCLALLCGSAFGEYVNVSKLEAYIDTFNKQDNGLYQQYVSNADSLDFLSKNIPMFECPDAEIESVYYFRWWTFRKHIRKTPEGFVITEFLQNVRWAGKYNAISCPAAMHFREGRWLADKSFLNSYARYWKNYEKLMRRYSFWAADSILEFHKVSPNPELLKEMYPVLCGNFSEWEKGYRPDSNGLFWQTDNADGMECSISGALAEKGKGYRATINSYMYGDAFALSKIANILGDEQGENVYQKKAEVLKNLINQKLWDNDANFYKVIPFGSQNFSDVRELHGYTPWYFNIAPAQYSQAWKQLSDTGGFRAPYGPTTAEQRHEKFAISYEGHECLWNGPSWPYATSITLVALGNLLNDYPATDAADKSLFFDTLQTFAMSHHRICDDGKRIFWIDENINPYNGEWISRIRLETSKDTAWVKSKGGKWRGDYYNHSEFCDIVITCLVGLRPSLDDMLVVNPLVPESWDWFCLENISYKGHKITVLFDKHGLKYNRGKGFKVYVDGTQKGAAKTLQKISIKL